MSSELREMSVSARELGLARLLISRLPERSRVYLSLQLIACTVHTSES